MYIYVFCIICQFSFSSLSICHRSFFSGDRCLHPVCFLRSGRLSVSTSQGFNRTYASAPAEVTTPCVADSGEYHNSAHYQCLCHYFTESEREVDEESFAHLKSSVVRRRRCGDGFIPTSFDVNALSIVPELFHENFSLRREDHWSTLMRIRRLYLDKIAAESELDRVSSRRSALAKTFHASPSSEQACLKEQTRSLRNDVKRVECHLKDLTSELESLVESLPNLVFEDVPVDDALVDTCVDVASLARGSAVFPHDKILQRLSLPCTSKSIDISGTGFSAFSGDLSRLERALFNYMLDTHHKLFGYTEVSVPFIVSHSTVKRTGHLPRFEEDLFKLDERHGCNGERAYLIPTAEIPLLALFGNSRIPLSSLPVWVMSHTPCFRSEIQNYGRLTRGLIRNHQFGKVELLCLCDSSRSDRYHSLMLSHIDYILRSLELPYRRVTLPASQLGITSSKTIDFEVYFPSLNGFVEVSSCSNTCDYQSTRLNLFGRPRSKIHCINGSGLAIGRTLSAILENYQVVDHNSNIAIRVPKVLQPYLGGQELIREAVA